MGSFIPAQPVQQLDVQDKYSKLMDMGMAVQNQKKMDAARTVEQGLKLMDMGIDPDYEVITRAAKVAGIPIPDAKTYSAQRAAGNPAAAPTPAVDPNQAAGVGGAIQGNKAGAQAGNPPSVSAANKAPGGGVIGPSAVSTQNVQKAVAGNLSAITEGQRGTPTPNQTQTQVEEPSYAQPVTPLNGSLPGLALQRRQALGLAAVGQAAGVQKQQAETAHSKMVAELATRVRNAPMGKIDFTDVGKLMALQGQNITPEIAKYGEMNDTQKDHFLNIASGMEEAKGEKLQREGAFRAALLTSPQTLKLVANPADAPRLVDSILAGNGFPSDVAAGQSMETMLQRAELLQKYAAVVPVKYAAKMADTAVAGGNPLDVIPSDARGIVELGLANEGERTKVAALGANADWMNAQTNAYQAKVAASKVDLASLTDPQLAQELKTFAVMAEARKVDSGLVDDKVFKGLQQSIMERAGLTAQEKQGMISKAFFGSWDWLMGSKEVGKKSASPEDVKKMSGKRYGASGTF
jgi:hypothetical protein